MNVPDSSLGVAFHIFVSTWLALFSYILNRPFLGHHLTIGRLSPCAAYNIRYSATLGDKTYALTFTSTRLTWHFHIPRPADPRWLTLTFHTIYYTSTTSDISTARLETVLWFFPVLFRQTAGPWANITIDDLRIKVFRSVETPYWIQHLRQNLIETILTGEILRADIFRTSFRFSGLTEHTDDKPSGYGSRDAALDTKTPDEEFAHEELEQDDDGRVAAMKADAFADEQGFETKALCTRDDDEFRFDTVVRQLHINNRNGRIYTFGRIDSQIRRNWVVDSGSFTMVAEECRWVHVHYPFERVAPRSWWTYVIRTLSS